MTDPGLQKLLDETKTAAIKAAQQETVTALNNQRTTLIKGIGDAVAEKLKSSEINVTTRVENAKSESVLWKIVSIALAPVLVAGFGYWTWRLQIGTNQTIERENQQLSSQLLLTVEYYKHRLEVYETFYKDLNRLWRAATNFQLDSTNPQRRNELFEVISELDSSLTENGFYIKKEVGDRLRGVWTDATEVSRGVDIDANMFLLKASISSAREEMKKEIPATGRLAAQNASGH